MLLDPLKEPRRRTGRRCCCAASRTCPDICGARPAPRDRCRSWRTAHRAGGRVPVGRRRRRGPPRAGADACRRTPGAGSRCRSSEAGGRSHGLSPQRAGCGADGRREEDRLAGRWHAAPLAPAAIHVPSSPSRPPVPVRGSGAERPDLKGAIVFIGSSAPEAGGLRLSHVDPLVSSTTCRLLPSPSCCPANPIAGRRMRGFWRREWAFSQTDRDHVRPAAQGQSSLRQRSLRSCWPHFRSRFWSEVRLFCWIRLRRSSPRPRASWRPRSPPIR